MLNVQKKEDITCGNCNRSFHHFLAVCFLSPYKGKVIDADTKEPIEGAAVLVVYSNFYPSVAGSISSVGDAQETLTDENGEFKIPWKVNLYGDAKFIPDGEVIIFKPGYGVLPRHKLSTAVGENKSWPPAFKYVVYEIPKLKTREEKGKNVLNIQIEYDLQFSKQKMIIEKVNEEFKNLGMIDRYIEKDCKPIRTLVR